jgi:uncharacterized membrane protein
VKEFTDKRLESSVSRMLLSGVILSALLVLFGGILYLRSRSTTTPDYRHFSASSTVLSSFAGIAHDAMDLDPDSVIQLGLLLLIATPVVRVAFCVVGFARQRDRLYVFISASVLCILAYSLVQGGR